LRPGGKRARGFSAGFMDSDLSSRQVLICVCGGIAAYKVCDVVSKLVQRGASVQVTMTAEAQHFVGATTFQALTARPVYTDLWTNLDAQDPQHIRLAQKSDLIVVAPATANVIAKMAHGLADDLISTLLLAANPRQILCAPAMNEAMWNHPATQRNCKTVVETGVELIGPGSGWQACRTVGQGRMSEAAEIVQRVEQRLKGSE
jgi:phosphopantothenoylcysteine decarboxylase/phosphopantothenate--cysteine ligase